MIFEGILGAFEKLFGALGFHFHGFDRRVPEYGARRSLTDFKLTINFNLTLNQ